jgi:tetratricopeptide (TPR) repeat protein
MSELEASRIDVGQGRVKEALPAIEENLNELRSRWARRQQGDRAFMAPDEDLLGRALASALDIAQGANLTLEHWQSCLDLLDEIDQVKHSIGADECELSRVRFNRYGPLVRLGKIAEAKAVLQEHLEVCQRLFDVPGEACALSGLADVWDELGDPTQAVAIERRALALRVRLADIDERAISHNNLAKYLDRLGLLDESKAHQLAALVYCGLTNSRRRDSRHNLAVSIRQSAARGETFTLPRLIDVLAAPAFATLRSFLAEHGIPADLLQVKVDGLIAQIRAVVTPT